MRSGMSSASMESAVEERTAASCSAVNSSAEEAGGVERRNQVGDGGKAEGWRRRRSVVRVRKERLELIDEDHGAAEPTLFDKPLDAAPKRVDGTSVMSRGGAVAGALLVCRDRGSNPPGIVKHADGEISVGVEGVHRVAEVLKHVAYVQAVRAVALFNQAR